MATVVDPRVSHKHENTTWYIVILAVIVHPVLPRCRWIMRLIKAKKEKKKLGYFYISCQLKVKLFVGKCFKNSI